VEKGIAPLISLPEDVPQVPPVPSIPSSPAAAFDLGGARWMKYRLIDGSGGTGEVRLEYSPESGMVSILRTLSSEDASAMSSSDGGLFYSMRFSSSQSSTTSSTASADRLRADDPVMFADGLTAGSAESDSVTVPGGTYAL